MKQPRLVVIGNGMAGIRTVEELLKLMPGMYHITVFGAEPASRTSTTSCSIRCSGITTTASTCM